MPTYSYRCTECDNAFDIVQAFTDDTLTVCPVCGGKLRKVFSPVGVSFTGSGFYRTDSRAAADPSSAKSSGDSGNSSSGGDSGSSSSSDGSKSSSPKTDTPKKEPTKAKPAAASSSNGTSS